MQSMRILCFSDSSIFVGMCCECVCVYIDRVFNSPITTVPKCLRVLLGISLTGVRQHSQWYQ